MCSRKEGAKPTKVRQAMKWPAYGNNDSSPSVQHTSSPPPLTPTVLHLALVAAREQHTSPSAVEQRSAGRGRIVVYVIQGWNRAERAAGAGRTGMVFVPCPCVNHRCTQHSVALTFFRIAAAVEVIVLFCRYCSAWEKGRTCLSLSGRRVGHLVTVWA